MQLLHDTDDRPAWASRVNLPPKQSLDYLRSASLAIVAVAVAGLVLLKFAQSPGKILRALERKTGLR